jgi:hypothetical protein
VMAVVVALMSSACGGALLGSSDDRPRASRQQCDYAAMHVGELKIGRPLDEQQRQRMAAAPEYARFMGNCERHSSMSAQCIIDATSLDQASRCK